MIGVVIWVAILNCKQKLNHSLLINVEEMQSPCVLHTSSSLSIGLSPVFHKLVLCKCYGAPRLQLVICTAQRLVLAGSQLLDSHDHKTRGIDARAAVNQNAGCRSP